MVLAKYNNQNVKVLETKEGKCRIEFYDGASLSVSKKELTDWKL